MNRARTTLQVLVLTVLTLLTSRQLAAQNAQLSGVVKDSSGGVIVDATLTITNQGTEVHRSAKTNKDGVYVIPFLQPGLYRVLIEAAGFQAESRSDIKLDVGQQARWDVALKVGQTGQSVTVTGDLDQVNAEDGSVSTVVDRNFVENLPLNGRGFNSLLELVPGVTTAKASANAQGQFNFNGQRSSSNYFTVDGVSGNTGTSAGAGISQTGAGTIPATSILGGMNALASVDALQEFRVMTSSFAPEFGRTPGGQISIATRSGTNKFHGDVFDYFRNDKMDANNWFANQTGLPRAALRNNDFGGVLGGPIVPDRTFFFFSYEGLRLREPQTAANLVVPSLAARQAAPAALQPILNAFPLPTGANLVNGLAVENAGYSIPGSFNSTALRVDHSLGKTNLFARYSYSPSSLAARGLSGGALSSLTVQTMGTWLITGGATSILSPAMTNEFRLNWTKTTATAGGPIDNFGGAQPLSITTLFPSSPSPETSRASLAIVGGLGLNYGVGETAVNVQRQGNITDSASLVKGKHVFKFGIDIRELRPVVGSPAYGLGFAYIGGIGDPTKTTAQQTPGSVLSDTVSVVQVTTRPARSGLEYQNFSSFAQDTWRVSPRLTLTYGLRWDVNPPPTGTNRPLYAIQNLQSLPNLGFATPGTSLWSTDYKNFGPRLGIAYRLRDSAEHGLVLRIGGGLFYDLTGGLVGTQPAYAPNVGSRQVANAAFPLTAAVSAQPSLPGSPPYTNSVGVDPALKTPRIYQWNIALEQQVGRQGTFSLTYVGSAGDNLLRATTLITPNATFSSLLLEQSNASSSYHSLQVQSRQRVGKRVQWLSSYSWSHSIDNSSNDVTATDVPFSKVDPNSDRGPSDFDVRHSFSTALTVSSPHTGGRWWSTLVRDWSMDSIFQAHSAFPIDVLLQRNIGFGQYSFRPDLVPGQPEFVPNANAGGGRQLSTAAFVVPTDPRQGDLGRNATRGFGMYQADLSVRREFSLTERFKLQVKLESFNFLNHPEFADPVTNLGTVSAAGALVRSAQFGLSQSMLGTQLGSGGVSGGLSPIYQIGGPRSTQLSMKVIF